MKYNDIPGNTMTYNELQWNTVEYIEIQRDTMKYNKHNEMQRNTMDTMNTMKYKGIQ